MLKLTVYIPDEALASVKQAMFDAGGGRLGLYSDCSWQVLGTGQFRPLPGSQPYLGSQGQVEVVPEWRVEILVQEERLTQVLEALLAHHPYEEPAYDVVELRPVTVPGREIE